VSAPAISRHSLKDEKVQACPYAAYAELREAGPVSIDPVTGFYIVSRYDLLRQVLLDNKNFIAGKKEEIAIPDGKRARIQAEFESKGWVPGPSLGRYDEPDHSLVRSLFEETFRASRVKEMDPFVGDVAARLIDQFLPEGRCEIVRQFAVPLPMIVFGSQMGAKDEELPKIKEWTDAWVKRLGMMLTDEEEMQTVAKQIEAQHYFQPVIDRLRASPNDTLFSDMVNSIVPGWDRPLTDNELHGHLMADTFVGGSETTANAISAGVLLLIQNPDVWQQLKSDPDKHSKTFCEEVLRLESPVQGLLRYVAADVELGGVPIPEGSIVSVQYAAANRDADHFPEPECLSLARKNAGSHLAFGSGIHHCLGAPLARRELYWAFNQLAKKVGELRLAPDQEELVYEPNLFLRRLASLKVELTPAAQHP